jgi:Translocon-associated protein beta (TRAPB)
MRASIRTAFTVLLLFASIAVPACAQDSTSSSEDDEYADEEKAFLIVRKAPLEDDVVVGSNLTVVIDIHNAGSRYASNDSVSRPHILAAMTTAENAPTDHLACLKCLAHVRRPHLQCRLLWCKTVTS